MRRALIWLGGSIAVIVVILLIGAVLLPWFIDSQWLKAKVGSVVAEKMQGVVTVGKIDLQWFPRPSVAIHGADLSFDKATKGTIRTVRIYPSIFYLLTGRLVMRRVQLQEPQFTLRLPKRSDQAIDLEDLEKNIQSAMSTIASSLPADRLELAHGSAQIEPSGTPPLTFEHLNAEFDLTSKETRFRLSARPNLCDRLRVNGEIAHADLAAKLHVRIDGLKLKPALALFPYELVQHVRRGEAGFTVDLASVGLRRVKAAVDGFAGSFFLMRGGEALNVKAKELKGRLVYEGQTLVAQVDQLELIAPKLRASGEFRVQPGSSSGRLKIREADIEEIRGQALRFAKDLAGVEKLFQFVRRGIINEMNFQSDGRSFAEMAIIKNIVAWGHLGKASISIPAAGLELKNVIGSVRLSGGVLEAQELAAHHGASKAWNGKLTVGLEGKNAPFNLDMSVYAAAAELHSIFLKLTKNKTLREELAQVRNLKGTFAGRVALGGTVDAITPMAVSSQIDVSASYDRIPFPIVIKSGRFNYNPNNIALENLSGTIGRSTLTGLNASLRNDATRQIRIDSGPISLDIKEAVTLLRSLGPAHLPLKELEVTRGHVDFAKVTFGGVHDNPAGWEFTSTGTIKQAVVNHADLPGPVSLSHAEFTATRAAVIFSQAALTLLDASFTADGTYETTVGNPRSLDASGMGIIGAKFAQWLHRRLELPKEVALRSPLKMDAGNLTWRADGDISFRGGVTVGGGPQLSLDLTRGRNRLVVRNLTIEDKGRVAHFTANLLEDSLDLSFQGELVRETVDKLFAAFPFQGSSLEGDFHVNVVPVEPVRFSARGQLSGNNLLIPLGTDKALFEEFHIEGVGPGVLIRSANLRWAKGRLMVSGKVADAKGILRLDLDVTGDQLEWEELRRSFGGDAKQREHKKVGFMSIPPVEATIRLKTDRFTFEQFNLSRLQTTATISSTGISADIDHGIMCGIEVTGGVTVIGKEIGLDLRFAASEGELETTTACLAIRQSEIKGIYSLKAHIVGRGDREQLLQSLKGNFEINARDGEFVRLPGVDATFDYLNETGDFKVAFPDLDRQSFPYRYVNVKGRIEGQLLVGDEINIDSSELNLSGQGEVDLARREVDGKGLVTVLKPVDEVISRIPLIGSIVGGSLLAIPVRVTGSLDRPQVSYLSPSDIGEGLLNVPTTILGLPLEAIRLFTPSQGEKSGDK